MAVTTLNSERFSGLARLYGRDALPKLAKSHVCVVGVGGVGSWAVEALARSGVGRLTLIDADEVCVSNANRQLHALDGQFGKLKVEVLAERCRAIAPEIVVDAIPNFLNSSNLVELLDRGYDHVFDACDSFRTKVEMIVWCRRRKLPLIVSGSAGGRVDPTRIQVRDLSRTEHDALLALIRKKLRGEYQFPRNPDRYFGVPAVFSLENVRYPQADGSVCGTRPAGTEGALKLDCGAGLGAAMHVTATFGMVAASRVIERLLR